MSLAEKLLHETLGLVLHPNEKREMNVRPDCLRNPLSGRNLELDVLLPRFPIGIEVQGPHHYREERQVFRDSVKRQLCSDSGIHLMEVSIFEIRPLYIRAKLLDYSREFKKHVGIQPRDPEKWDELDKRITEYRKQILATFGPSDDYTTPRVREEREANEIQNDKLARCLYVVLTRKGGKQARARPIKWTGPANITVRILGDDSLKERKVPRSSIVGIV